MKRGDHGSECDGEKKRRGTRENASETSEFPAAPGLARRFFEFFLFPNGEKLTEEKYGTLCFNDYNGADQRGKSVLYFAGKFELKVQLENLPGKRSFEAAYDIFDKKYEKKRAGLRART